MIELRLDPGDVDRLLTTMAGTQHLRDGMEESLAILHGDIARYPRQRSGSRYVRGRGMANSRGQVRRLTSQRLGTRWTTRVSTSGGEIKGEVGNNVTYGPYVQDAQRQARVHRGVWQTDEDVINQNQREIVGVFDRVINQYGRG